MKSLETIQKLAKVGLLLCRIKLVCSLIGFFGCIAGLVFLQVGNGSSVKLGGLVLHGLMDVSGGANWKSASAVLTAGIVMSAGSAVVAWFARNYFENELIDGTPFTRLGAQELKQLGIIVIVVPLATAMIAEIVQAIAAGIMGIPSDLSFNLWDHNEISIALGIVFLIFSVICNYGVEQMEHCDKKERIDGIDMV